MGKDNENGKNNSTNYLTTCHPWIIRTKGRISNKHLIHNSSKRPPITFHSIALFEQNFRCHVIKSSNSWVCLKKCKEESINTLCIDILNCLKLKAEIKKTLQIIKSFLFIGLDFFLSWNWQKMLTSRWREMGIPMLGDYVSTAVISPLALTKETQNIHQPHSLIH